MTVIPKTGSLGCYRAGVEFCRFFLVKESFCDLGSLKPQFSLRQDRNNPLVSEPPAFFA